MIFLREEEETRQMEIPSIHGDRIACGHFLREEEEAPDENPIDPW